MLDSSNNLDSATLARPQPGKFGNSKQVFKAQESRASLFFRLQWAVFSGKAGCFSCSRGQARNRIVRKIDSHHYLM